MALIYGTKDTGKSGVLSVDELAKLLHRKSGERAEIGNCTTCATYISNKTSTASGGGTSAKDAGRTVYHISSGKRGSEDGCTAFFTLTEGEHGEVKGDHKVVKDVLVAGIVGVGWHTGATDHIYKLDWGNGRRFYTGNKFDTSVANVKP
jgi:hypothetical protein